MKDSYSRNINYLRISITERCNLRCVYCMPEEGVQWVPHSEVLSYEHMLRVVEAAADLGITKVRVTGGEPTVRAGVVDFIKMLSQVTPLDDISMTSNGIMLPRLAGPLKEAGLKRVNISLDTLRPDRFRTITRVGKLDDVMAGIRAAWDAGLSPIKLNTVVMQGFNEDEIADIARLSVDEDLHVRFIELMPFTDTHCSLGQGKAAPAFMPYQQVMEEVERRLGKLEAAKPPVGNGPARYYRLPGARGTIGFISPVSEDHFCTHCNRLRLTAEGKLRPSLLKDSDVDLKPALLAGASRQELSAVIGDVIRAKPQNHLLRQGQSPNGRKMVQIGG